MHPPFTTEARAPGRVNLIGEHTDYEDGWCLPIAIELETSVRFRAASGDTTVVTSDQFDGAVEFGPTTSGTTQTWGNAVCALVQAMHERGHPIGPIVAAAQSTVPLGSGLSSSASFTVALAMALSSGSGASGLLHGVELALTAQRAEHLNGVPCGIMDQMASVFGQPDHAVLIDCRTTEVRMVPIPKRLGIIVVHSGLPRRLADSQYAQRRAACAQACDDLGIRALRDATIDQVRGHAFARHVVSENERVHQFVAALAAGDNEQLGTILDASHHSLAVDFEVSTPQLDTLCATLRECGALGARLTGAGFGGCVVALAPIDDADHIAVDSAQRYREATGLQPLAFTTRASAGASVMALNATNTLSDNDTREQ